MRSSDEGRILTWTVPWAGGVVVWPTLGVKFSCQSVCAAAAAPRGIAAAWPGSEGALMSLSVPPPPDPSARPPCRGLSACCLQSGSRGVQRRPCWSFARYPGGRKGRRRGSTPAPDAPAHSSGSLAGSWYRWGLLLLLCPSCSCPSWWRRSVRSPSQRRLSWLCGWSVWGREILELICIGILSTYTGHKLQVGIFLNTKQLLLTICSLVDWFIIIIHLLCFSYMCLSSRPCKATLIRLQWHPWSSIKTGLYYSKIHASHSPARSIRLTDCLPGTSTKLPQFLRTLNTKLPGFFA